MKNQKGITLIALVITIIVLLILAGVSISMILGNNGIIQQSRTASEEYTKEAATEKINLKIAAIQSSKYAEEHRMPTLQELAIALDEDNEIEYVNTYRSVASLQDVNFTATSIFTKLKEYPYEFEINNSLQIASIDGVENVPEDLPDDIGTEVALKDGWGLETVSYVKTDSGLPITNVTKVATVYAVSIGDGQVVPVPKGFYYVGGNFETGVIISDNEADKYDGKTDKTTYEYARNLQGNQFVWIPCTTSEYQKCSTWNGTTQTNSKLGNAYWDTTIPKSELSQIEKYGGFYVARYEAGLAETIPEFTTNSNQIYNLDGIPQSKAGVIPWMYIDWTHSKANAESMYNNNYVSSGLITGTQWDVILNTLVNKTDLTAADMTNSGSWGNYMDNAIEYTGRVAVADYGKTNSSAWTLKPFGEETTGKTTSYSQYNGHLLTTGASQVTEKYHIFDIAGNLWEWTEEDSHYATSGQYRVFRGGSFIALSGTHPACFRGGSDSVSDTFPHFGFRAVLYIK